MIKESNCSLVGVFSELGSISKSEHRIKIQLTIQINFLGFFQIFTGCFFDDFDGDIQHSEDQKGYLLAVQCFINYDMSYFSVFSVFDSRMN